MQAQNWRRRYAFAFEDLPKASEFYFIVICERGDAPEVFRKNKTVGSSCGEIVFNMLAIFKRPFAPPNAVIYSYELSKLFLDENISSILEVGCGI